MAQLDYELKGERVKDNMQTMFRNDIAVLKIEKSDVKIDEHDTEAVKSFTETFLNNLDKFWQELDLSQKQVFQSQIFPAGVVCQDKNIRTTNLFRSFEII